MGVSEAREHLEQVWVSCYRATAAALPETESFSMAGMTGGVNKAFKSIGTFVKSASMMKPPKGSSNGALGSITPPQVRAGVAAWGCDVKSDCGLLAGVVCDEGPEGRAGAAVGAACGTRSLPVTCLYTACGTSS